MTNWQEKVERVMMAGTSDLKELARMVGHDPAIFWRDANFRRADLSEQDLSGLDLSQATIAPRFTMGSAGKPLATEDGGGLESALLAMDEALTDWAKAPKCLNSAIKALRSIIKQSKQTGDQAQEADARHLVAKANLLLGEYDSAETEIRRARKLYEGLDQDNAVAQCLDTRGMSLRLRAYQQDETAALNSLGRAASVFETSKEHDEGPRNRIRTFGTSRDRTRLVGETRDESISELRKQIQTLELIWSPTTSFVLAEASVAAKIAYCGHRIVLAELTRNDLGVSARETLRTNLLDALRSAAGNRFFVDWMDGRYWLAELDKIDGGAHSDRPAEGDVSLDAAQHLAMQRALEQMALGDAKISELMKGSIETAARLEEALEHYAEAENLYGLLEDVSPLEQEPGRNHALLRRGIAHLLKATDTSISGEALAEAIQEGSFSLDLAAANLGGRNDVPLALAEAWDAQAFALRLEAHFSTGETAQAMISRAAALHRRASQVQGLPRADGYRYRVHFFGTERELEERRQSRLERFKVLRMRVEKALDSFDARAASRTSAAERASFMALQAEYVMLLVAELKLTEPTDVAARWVSIRDETRRALEVSTGLATKLFMPLDWMMLHRTRAQLERLDQS